MLLMKSLLKSAASDPAVRPKLRWARISPVFEPSFSLVPAIDSNGVERWRLRAQARGESAEVFAAARCYLKDQR